MAKKQPHECQFGIIDNYETMFQDDATLGIFISWDDEGGAYDNVYTELLTSVPSWLPTSVDMECHWYIPSHVTRDQAIQDMLDLGYVHNQEWDDDYA